MATLDTQNTERRQTRQLRNKEKLDLMTDVANDLILL